MRLNKIVSRVAKPFVYRIVLEFFPRCTKWSDTVFSEAFTPYHQYAYFPYCTQYIF